MSIARYFNPKLRPLIGTEREPAWLRRHPRRRYICAVVMSSPDWAPRWKLQLLHLWKGVKTRQTGVEHVLDHIVPLCHPYVSGLTVPWNLQIVPRKVNSAKSNKFMPDQIELL